MTISRHIQVQTCTFDEAEQDYLVIESTKRINYNDRFDRTWLEKHTLWALSNQRSVTLFPIRGK